MEDENHLILKQKKSSDWDEGIFYVLLAIIIAIPVIFYPYCNPTFSPAKNLFLQILTLLGLVMWKFKLINCDKLNLNINIIDKLIILYLVFGCLSIIWSINIYQSVLALPLFLVGPILYFVVSKSIQEQGKIEKLLIVIIILGTMMGIYGFFQYLGIDFQFWSGNIFRQKVMGLFGNVNYFAEYLILPLSLTVGFVLSTENHFNRYFFVVAFIIMSLTLFLTFTRSAYLAIVLSIPVILLLYYRSASTHADKRHYKKIIFYFLLIVIISMTIIYIPHPLNKENTPLAKLRERVTIESLTSGSSILRRIATWKFTWMMIEDYPFLGSGLGTYDYLTLNYQAEFFAKGNNRDIYPHGIAVQAHNEYLQLWSELGFIGLFIFLWIIFVYYRNIFIHIRKMKEKHKAIVISLSGGVTAVLIDSFFGFPSQLPASLSLFWIFIGLTIAQINISNYKENKINYYTKYSNDSEDKHYEKTSNTTGNKIKKIILYLLVATVMVISILFLIRPFGGRIYWYYGEKQIEQGNYNEAIKMYEKGLSWNPWQGEMYYGIGVILTRGGINQLALDYLHKAEKYFDYHYLPQNIGNLYIKKGDIKNSIPYLEKAIKYQPEKENMLPLQLQLGNIYLTIKDFKNAERLFTDAVHDNPNSEEAYYGLAGAYLNQGNKEQGIEALQKVIELAPDSKLAGYAKTTLTKIKLEEE